jgi:hypothetical protein
MIKNYLGKKQKQKIQISSPRGVNLQQVEFLPILEFFLRNILFKYSYIDAKNIWEDFEFWLRVCILIVWWVLVPSSVTGSDPDIDINRDPKKAGPDWMVQTCLKTGQDWTETNY